MQALMEINTWANRCGYFFNAYLDPDTQSSANNGYNCRHTECKRHEGGVGCCHSWACPLGYQADGEDCVKFGVDCDPTDKEMCEKRHLYEYCDFIVVDIPPENFNEDCMWKRIDEISKTG